MRKMARSMSFINTEVERLAVTKKNWSVFHSDEKKERKSRHLCLSSSCFCVLSEIESQVSSGRRMESAKEMSENERLGLEVWFSDKACAPDTSPQHWGGREKVGWCRF